jgi:hypothetical protein
VLSDGRSNSISPAQFLRYRLIRPPATVGDAILY